MIPIYDKHSDGQIRKDEWLAFFEHLFDLDFEEKHKKTEKTGSLLNGNDLKVLSIEENLIAPIENKDS